MSASKLLHIFRGHEKPPTAITYYSSGDQAYLLSGDQEGTLIVWSLNLLRLHSKHYKSADSQVQSLRVLKLSRDVLFVHSRDTGIKLFALESMFSTSKTQSSLETVRVFQSFESLFSRGDAITIDNNKAVLAFPFKLENHIVSIVILDSNGDTIVAGNAHRFPIGTSKTSSVFDLTIVDLSGGLFHLYAGYEDGCVCIFEFKETSTISFPALNATGLKLSLIKKYNLDSRDFVSAFDVGVSCDPVTCTLVCGSPGKKLIFVHHATESRERDLQATNEIKLAKQGVSAIAIRPDNNLVAVARWNGKVEIYSMTSHKLVATLDQHSKQVQSLLFIKRPESMQAVLSCLSEVDGHSDEKEGIYLLCCASLEGTISVLSVY